MLPMGKKQSIHTERNVIDGQITHEVLFSRQLIPPFAIIKQPITAIVHLIAICHSKDQRPLKAEHLPIDSRTDASWREMLRTGRYDPPTGAGFLVTGKGARVSSLV